MNRGIEDFYTKIRNSDAFRHLVPLETVLSFPVPILQGGSTYLRFFVYRLGERRPDKSRAIYRPYLRLTAAYPSGTLVEYMDLRFAEGFSTAEQVDSSPHAALADHSFEEVLVLRQALFAATEDLLLSLGTQQTGDEAALRGYAELFDTVVAPGLRPYYQELNPTLFRRIREVISNGNTT